MTVVVGIDPSTQKLAVVVRKPGSIKQHTYKLPQRDRDGTRYSEAYDHILSLLYDIVKPQGELGKRESVYVFLEYPIYWRGGKSTLPLAMLSGAVQAAVHKAEAKLEMVHNQMWKKRVVGAGNVKKEEIADWLELHHLELFNSANGDQDMIDAHCIGLYGQRVINLRTRMKRTRQRMLSGEQDSN